jgi:hypothetical protein
LYFSDLLQQIKTIHAAIENRSDLRDLRASAFEEQMPIVKIAFDTRRINQQTEFNPRRNLQYYHRSDPFITGDLSTKIKTLFKLKTAVDNVKEDFIGDPDWQDSYCRVLSAALDRTLRIEQRDMDFAKPQFDYLDELLYLRYRIKDDDINKLNEKELRNIVLGKDEKLLHKQIYANYDNASIKKTSIQPNSQDALIEKLFGGVKASAENKSVERTISITINDKLKDA